MGYAKHGGDSGGYRLPGLWNYTLTRQQAMADAPDPRVNLVDEGPARDRLIELDRQRCAIDPAYRKAKCTLDIERLEAGLPVLIRRGMIDTRPIHPNEEPGRQSWPEAKMWPEVFERSVRYFELHLDDRLVPVPGDVNPTTYWSAPDD